MGIGSNVRAFRKAKEWSQAELAEASGVSQQLISQIERDVNESTRELPALARALGVRAADIDPAFRDDQVNEVRSADIPLPAVRDLPRDIPVLGTAAGSDHARGAFQLSAEAVDYVRRPPALATSLTAYALYVEGDSMSPKFEPGDLIYVNPSRPARPGDFVVIEEMLGDGERRGFVKLYVKRSGSWHIVRQFNPEAELRFPAEERSVQVHKVLSLADLLGT